MGSFLRVALSSLLAACTADRCQERPPAPLKSVGTVTAAADKPVVRIMPLGDSITRGVGSTTISGYRSALWQRMAGLPGHSVVFVGSQRNGQLEGLDHEGHSGWQIDQIAAKVDVWLAAYPPEVVLLHIGTNDMSRNYDVSRAPERVSALIDRIFEIVPGVTVVVAQIVPALISTVNARIIRFNEAIPGVVQSKVAQGKRVHMVDMFHPFTDADLVDALHPNDAGYAKMAGVWYSALTVILRSRAR